jgi:hypothetical protein
MRTGIGPAKVPKEVVVLEIGALVGVALLGFAAGLFSFKVKTRWCTRCGDVLQCVACWRGSRNAF